MLTLHNTLTGHKDAFQPLDPQRVTLYVCGPTVYNYVHIGNARPVVVFDVLYRLLSRLYPKWSTPATSPTSTTRSSPPARKPASR